MAVDLDCVDNMAVDEGWEGARTVQAVHDAVRDSTRTRQVISMARVNCEEMNAQSCQQSNLDAWTSVSMESKA